MNQHAAPIKLVKKLSEWNNFSKSLLFVTLSFHRRRLVVLMSACMVILNEIQAQRARRRTIVKGGT